MKRTSFFRKSREDFSRSVLASLVFHILIIILVCVVTHRVSITTREINPHDTKAFIKALAEIQEEMFPNQNIKETDPQAAFSNEEFFRILEGVRIPDLNLSEKQKIEFYKNMLKRYMVSENAGEEYEAPELNKKDISTLFKQTESIQLDSGGKIYSSRNYSDGSKNFFYLPQQDINTLKRLRRFEDMERTQMHVRGKRVKLDTEEGVKFIPETYYFRESPYEDILAQGAELFFITRGFPSLGESSLFEGRDRNRAVDSFLKGLSPNFQVVYLYEDLSTPSPLLSESRKKKQALNISSGSINRILDDLMELKEDQQFFHFKQNYLDQYHPDKGNLAQLLREFIYNNQSNIIIMVDDITGAFAFVEELYFNKPMDTYLARYWKQFPQTQTGVECLFCLASFYDFERRGLTYLFRSYDKAKELVSQKYYRVDAFNKKAKAYVVKEMYETLISALMKKGYETEMSIVREYFEEEENLYRMICETGGRNRDRALYSWGRLYWDQKEYDLALEKWDQIKDFSSFEISDEIRDVLESSMEKDTLVYWLDKIFIRESNESNEKLLKRLLKYHRWAKRAEKEQ